MGLIARLFGGRPDPVDEGGTGAERRKHARYPVSAPIEAILRAGTPEESRHPAAIANVSAGGAMLTVAIPAAAGEEIGIFNPTTTMSVEAVVVSVGEDQTRVRFESESAGAVVSIWLRELHGPAGS